jgi:hypothetical protein
MFSFVVAPAGYSREETLGARSSCGCIKGRRQVRHMELQRACVTGVVQRMSMLTVEVNEKNVFIDKLCL